METMRDADSAGLTCAKLGQFATPWPTLVGAQGLGSEQFFVVFDVFLCSYSLLGHIHGPPTRPNRVRGPLCHAAYLALLRTTTTLESKCPVAIGTKPGEAVEAWAPWRSILEVVDRSPKPTAPHGIRMVRTDE